MDVVKISLEALIQRATNPQNENIDTAAVEAFCALINKEKDGPLIGIKLLATRMHSKNEQEALQTLHILDYSMQKCGSIFQDEVGKFRFLNEMIKLVSPKYLGSHTPLSVKQKVLQLMYLWMLDYPKQSKIKDAYDMLKKQGVIKDVPLSVSADYTLERQHNTIFQDEEKGKLLKKLLQSKNPEDLQAANRLIKTMVKEDEKKAELKSRRISELESVQNNIRLLNEMLDSYKTGVSSQDETELIKELHESCLRMRPNIVKLASETQQTDEILSEILRVNDELGQVLDKYKLVIVMGQDVQAVDKTSLLDLSSYDKNEMENNLERKSNVDMLCDILTAPINEATQGGSAIASILKPIAVTSQLENKEINGDADTQTNKQKAFETLDALGESLLMENLQSSTRLGNQFNKTDKIPMNMLSAKSQSALANINLSQLSQLSQLTSSNHNVNNNKILNADKIHDLNSASKIDLDVDLTKLLLSSSSSNEEDVSDSHTNGSSLDDLLVDITTTPIPTPTLTPTLSRTISSSSTASISVNGLVSEKKDIEEKETNCVNDIKTTLKLSDLFVDLKSIKPSNIEPIIALNEEHGITLTLHFGRDKPHEDVSVLVVTMISKNELPLKNVLFRAIVPKCCKLKLQPASAPDLPGYNPFLPPAAITQVMLISNPERVQVSLKFIVSYNVDDETMTEMGEIDALPI